MLISFTYLIATNFSKNPLKNSTVKTELISSDVESSVIRFSFENFKFIDIQTTSGIIKKISLGGAFPMQIAGSPDLLKISASVIIPDDADMKVEVISESFIDYQNIEIAPSKGNLYRNINPSDIPYLKSSKYNINEFYPGKLAELQQPYILRDYRGQTITVYPFQYNPVTKVLRVYNDLKVKVSRQGISNVNRIIRNKSINKIDKEYSTIYKNHFLNNSSGNSKYTIVNEQGKMLIICPELFIPSMQAFVNWKNISGIPTEIVSVATAGSTNTAIKNYISNYYTNNGLTFVILVGDVAQLPTFTVSGGGSDNTYSYLAGNDHYPEIFVGRISAETILHVQTQVQKFLSYEKTPSNINNWLNKGCGIASDQGPGDNNEYDYQHIRAIRTKLLNYQYSFCSELYDGNQGGIDAIGNPTAALVANDVNSGVGIMYYTGHGSDNSWGTTGFSNTNISALSNTSAWPFIFSVACVNGNFTTGTCFAEAWMRATYNSQPSGAISTLMSTINQSWNPPMCGQDAMIDLLTENTPGNIKQTFGGISMNGCMKMNDNYTTAGDEMTDTWNIFGDPSLLIRTDTAKTMIVSHNPVVFLGAASFAVNCNVNGGRVTLSKNNLAIGSALVVNGIATINFNALSGLDTITVVATAYNYIPYTGQINVIIPNGPFVQFNNSQIVDVNGNNNTQADYNENITLNIDLKNVGVAIANNVVATLSTTDTNVIITDNQQNWGNIAANAISGQNNAFALTIKNNISDQHSVNFNLSIVDGNSNTWNTGFSVVLNAPSLYAGNFIIKDTIIGNNNGKLDPGETAVVYIPSSNNGHSNSANASGKLSCISPYLSILSADSLTFSTLNQGSTLFASYKIKLDSIVPTGTMIVLNYLLSTGFYQSNSTYYQIIGLVNEDFETGNFTKFNWIQGGDAPWTLTNSNQYEGSYSAKSGVIANSKSSSLLIQVNVTANDTVTFYKKVSCEDAAPNTPAYDYLEFFIDNTSMGRWDGEEAWSKSSYPITNGVHSLKWIYKKDSYGIAGSDCAWLDNIKFPGGIVSKAPLSCTLTAANDTICGNTPIQLQTIVNGGLGNNVFSYTANQISTTLNGSNPTVSPNITTVYSVTVTDANNATANALFTLNVKSVSAGPIISIIGNQIVSDATINQWYDDNGIIPNATSNVYTPIHTGNYYAKKMNANACYSLPSNIVYIGSLSINENNFLEANVFPNPFNNELKIEINKENLLNISIFNAMGQLIIISPTLTSINNKQIISYNTSSLKKGIYFIQIKTTTKNSITKMIKVE